ncbi:hypothetical protein [Neorhizobium tomejilense]|uniref:hypothetical protein n=1 Tax=Neorhizobium tomejilense TaxID=2093828 RepID=UPI003ED0410B
MTKARKGKSEQKIRSTKASAKDVPTPEPPGRRIQRRKIESAIKRLNVATLADDQIEEIVRICTATMNLRKAINSNEILLSKSDAAELCYFKAADDPIVTVMRGDFIVHSPKYSHLTKEQAEALGIFPCARG